MIGDVLLNVPTQAAAENLSERIRDWVSQPFDLDHDLAVQRWPRMIRYANLPTFSNEYIHISGNYLTGDIARISPEDTIIAVRFNTLMISGFSIFCVQMCNRIEDMDSDGHWDGARDRAQAAIPGISWIPGDDWLPSQSWRPDTPIIDGIANWQRELRRTNRAIDLDVPSFVQSKLSELLGIARKPTANQQLLISVLALDKEAAKTFATSPKEFLNNFQDKFGVQFSASQLKKMSVKANQIKNIL